jgi:hypothetical protein
MRSIIRSQSRNLPKQPFLAQQESLPANAEQAGLAQSRILPRV